MKPHQQKEVPESRTSAFLIRGHRAEHVVCFQAATVLVDGIYPSAGLKAKQVAVPNGDEKSAAIAAASVVAKVASDELMRQLDQEFVISLPSAIL